MRQSTLNANSWKIVVCIDMIKSLVVWSHQQHSNWNHWSSLESMWNGYSFRIIMENDSTWREPKRWWPQINFWFLGWCVLILEQNINCSCASIGGEIHYILLSEEWYVPKMVLAVFFWLSLKSRRCTRMLSHTFSYTLSLIIFPFNQTNE